MLATVALCSLGSGTLFRAFETPTMWSMILTHDACMEARTTQLIAKIPCPQVMLSLFLLFQPCEVRLRKAVWNVMKLILPTIVLSKAVAAAQGLTIQKCFTKILPLLKQKLMICK
eukprot:TRINITY_DN25376_c0_g1_i3.p1 TRINITY_DN25376_c0_g1~~TRINITY_DN25376_c0_g1_i3.p1  ORF type:complete len:115 (-),score=21.00 TRINITY_DN25376_c0_g1_i3:251-595(-)